MEVNEAVGKALDWLADEVKKRIGTKDATAEELAGKLTETLAHADWMKDLVKDIVMQRVDVTQDDVKQVAADEVASRVGDEVNDWLEKNFDLSNYENEVERMAENVVDNYDFSDKVREGIDDHDFSSQISDAVEEQLDSKLEDFKRALRDALA